MDTVIVISKDSFIIRNQLDTECKTTEKLKTIPTKVTSRDFSFDELLTVQTSRVPETVLCNLCGVQVLLFQAQLSRDP